MLVLPFVQVPSQIAGRLPVLVFFLGGAFLSGSGNHRHITPDSIMKHDLVLVTVNYRLGPLGRIKESRITCAQI